MQPLALRVVLLAVLALAFTTVLHAQQRGTVVGQVNDFQSGKPMKVYVLLYNDSTLQTGVASDSLGNFKLNNVPQGQYSLRIKLYGYVTEVTPTFQVHTSSLNMGTLNMNKIPKRFFGAALWRKRKYVHMYL